MPACLLILLAFMLQQMKKPLVYVIDDGCTYIILYMCAAGLNH